MRSGDHCHSDIHHTAAVTLQPPHLERQSLSLKKECNVAKRKERRNERKVERQLSEQRIDVSDC